jgi:TonB-dependent receptor
LLVAAAVGERASAQEPPDAQTNRTPRAGEGRIAGRVVDEQTGAPQKGVTVILNPPAPADGSAPRQEFRVTDTSGEYLFDPVPAGHYRLEFLKTGYSSSNLADVAVESGREARGDMRITARAADPGESGTQAVGPVETITVHGDTSKQLLSTVERRAQSDEMVNVLGAGDLSKFAAVDMADALKRVAGVSVVEGQFAIIRGLEDRYSSTLYNGAVIPSPDPERQSVQLDLFPSKIVDQTVVTKNFAPDLPSNSSGGSINILTPSHPEDQLEISLRVKGSLNDNAYDRFIQFHDQNPVGDDHSSFNALGGEYGGDVRGHTSFHDHEIRFKALGNYEVTHGTEEGWKEGRQPAKFRDSSHFPAGDLAFGELSLTDGRFDETTSTQNKQLTLYGDLGFDVDELGDHSITASVFYTRKDTEKVRFREDGFLPGFDYASIQSQFENGDTIDPGDFVGTNTFRPGITGSPRAWIATKVATWETPPTTAPPFQGHAWFDNFYESRSFDISRDLQIYQLNGEHVLDEWVDGLHASWAGNYAATKQDETVLDARITYDPCGIYGNDPTNTLRCPTGVTPLTDEPSRIPTAFPHSIAALGPGKYLVRKGLFASGNNIDEEQYFARLDGEYKLAPLDWLGGEIRSGLWYEHAKRDVDSRFLSNDKLSVTGSCTEAQGCITSGSPTDYVIWGDNLSQVGQRVFSTALLRNPDGTFASTKTTTSEATREVQALHIDGKATFWDDVDVLGGVRLEWLQIESKNDPFQRNLFSFDGSGNEIFPTKYLMFDRLDNIVREGFNLPPPYNDQILGIKVPIGPCRDQAGNPIPAGQFGAGQCVDLINEGEVRSLIDGKIDEKYALPAAGLNYRPFRWMTLRGAYSESYARPSFRELGYYVSVASSAKTDDLTVGNPQLQLSHVESWDARTEFVWGSFADLFAVSVFQKDIEKPIEQIVVLDQARFEKTSDDTFRTFFNNPSDAEIRGIEFEARKSLTLSTFDFLGWEIPNRDLFEFLDYLSIGGNYSYFDAEVHRSVAELQRAKDYFGDTDGNPQGIRNPPGPTPYQGLERKRRLYGQPEWIANADITFDHPLWGTQVTLAWFAISDVLDAAGVAAPDRSGTITQFTLDRYLDSYGQLDLIVSQKLWRGFSVKFSAKNLTDSTRRIIYDKDQTAHKVVERQYRRGRDYGLQFIWKF